MNVSLLRLLLAGSGALCPRCGYGTRATSKNWMRCKREGCDGRARRRPMEEVAAEIKAMLADSEAGQEQAKP